MELAVRLGLPDAVQDAAEHVSLPKAPKFVQPSVIGMALSPAVRRAEPQPAARGAV